MNIEQINTLDNLLLVARKSMNSNHLDFDENGAPLSPPIDKDIYFTVCSTSTL